MPPRKSRATVNAFLNTLYDASRRCARPTTTRRPWSFRSGCKRRSLVVILSNLRDEDDETLLPALALLERKHLVLFANLRESSLDRVRAEPVKDLEGALRYAAAARLRARAQRHDAARAGLGRDPHGVAAGAARRGAREPLPRAQALRALLARRARLNTSSITSAAALTSARIVAFMANVCAEGGASR